MRDAAVCRKIATSCPPPGPLHTFLTHDPAVVQHLSIYAVLTHNAVIYYRLWQVAQAARLQNREQEPV